ncbi:nucleotidyltransferase family protein [Pseudothauera rhizosphaerae]|uniref:cGAS/DncV-like nucleotidyltransferase C-terminal helical domain-containing protein n=1 Tax=Pseudothauera rhizosphaerae TaxID=2565932 RepID=A0A4S4ALE3_9RHOO|nr:hypothetical protein [Pseudothauera rhizosphaerae]THF60346.1 hypothetical protein E6O51_14155 [Pseudothauera rhizosphaerae]
MATDYANRIGRVNARRNNTAVERFTESVSFAAASAFGDSVTKGYQSKTKSKSFQYALVSMQEVDPQYTAISYREADRVAKQIDLGLSRRGRTVSIELQGSLPLNVHLRRVSDVDMLVWPWSFFVFDGYGIAASSYSVSTKNTVSEITSLRSECCSVISSAFPAAKINDSGAKCITVSEGSLLREIDVVPSVLYKTATYQKSNNDEDRGVQIYDNKLYELITNYPFKVRALINAKEDRTGGGCKKAIRLLKNMKEDSDTLIALSSFNIMSLVYAMQDSDLVHSSYYEGKIVTSLQSWFFTLAHDETYLRRLDTVDGSRKIMQSAADVAAVSQMSEELNVLVLRIAQELQSDVPNSFPAWRAKVESELLF